MSAAAGPPVGLPPPGSAVHLMGVGGAGMRGLALVLAEAGYRVSGCDRAPPEAPELVEHGVRLREGHDPAHVEGADMVIVTAAVPEDAPELAAAREAGIPVLKRARALGALLAGRRVVGIAGTHGKTTITAMAGLACEAAGLDPTVLVGGRVCAWGGFARAGHGPLAVVEADEFDRSFLELHPALAVVSSIEPEHLESYGSEREMRKAYRVFASRAADREGVLWCADDAGAARVCEPLGGKSYGLAAWADYVVKPVSGAGAEQRCRFRWEEGELDVHLRVPGVHNAQNAGAALAVVCELGGDPWGAALRLAEFTGVDRRLQVLADRNGVAVVDDYAHHPTEVGASLAALRRRFPGRRLVAVFQPHLFSRTQAFAAEFAAALLGTGQEMAAADRGRVRGADEALVLPIYPAREDPLPGVTSSLIAEAGEAPGLRLASADEALERVREAVAEAVERHDAEAAGEEKLHGVVFDFMGAGDVTALAAEAAGLVSGERPA